MSAVTGRPQASRLIDEGHARDQSRLEFSLLLLCLFFSGLAALLYQIAWMRQLAIVFGTSELAIAAVLAAYMGGLASGAAVAGRYVMRIRRLVLAYGLLEFTIAAGALLVPSGLWVARRLLISVLGGQPSPPDAEGWTQPAFYLAMTFLVLLIPTACMGATLPLLAQHAVRHPDQIGRRVGLLYAMNTLGAVVGTLLAGFLLLPWVGLFRTTLCGVAVNGLVFVLAVWVSRLRRAPEASAPAATAASALLGRLSAVPSWLLPSMLVSGFVSFTYEVLWTRLLGHLVGGSTHAFATMLATFLTGITLGSMLAAPLAQTRVLGLWGFAAAQFGTAVLSMGMYEILEALPRLFELSRADQIVHPLWNALRCSIVLLPSTVCIGATFPFAVRGMTDDPAESGPVAARIYAWNTVGAVLGAVVAGFLVIPELEFHGSIRLAVGLNLALAALTLVVLPLQQTLRLAGIGAAVFLGLMYRPLPPETLLSTSAMRLSTVNDDTVYLGVGRSSTVRVARATMFYTLTNNGLPEAMFSPPGAPTLGLELNLWLTALPLIARPDAQSMLVIGFGSGGALEIVSPSVREIDVIELEPEVIAANRECAALRNYDPLSDPRVHVVVNDARGALSLTDKVYDIVVSQPSHPWTAGASHVYTREFMQMVADHLAPNGVFLQWMNTAFVDDELFRSLGQTLLDVFPRVRLYQPQEDIMFFLAADGDLDVERLLYRSGEPLGSAPEAYRLMGLNGISELASTLVLDDEGLRTLCAGAPLNTDDQNRLGFASAHNLQATAAARLHRLIKSADAILHRQSSLYDPPDLPVNPAVMAYRLTRARFTERTIDLANAQPQESHRALLLGILRNSQGKGAEAARFLLDSYLRDPSLTDAGFMLCELSRRALVELSPPRELQEILQSLPEPESLVMRAVLALERDDFEAVRQLDEELAAVSPERLCYGLAVHCRAGWRAAAVNAPNREQLAREAIALTDQSIAIMPRATTLLMRYNAATMLDDLDAVVETALHIAIKVDVSEPGPRTEQLRQIVQQVIVPRIQRLRDDPRVNPHRVAEAHRLLERLMLQGSGPGQGDSLPLPRDVENPSLPF
jgi:spermidine synthase